ncbi:Methionine aminopeptidase 1 [Hypoxylon texense]
MPSATGPTPTTFNSYRRFPPELKLNLWEQLSMPRGVHHFDFETAIRSYNGLTQNVTIRPKNKAQDTSAWRVRNRAKWIDEYSWYALSKNLEAKPKTRQFWPPVYKTSTENPPRMIDAGPQKIEEGTDVAIVDLENDLVCFTTKGMVLHNHFMHMFRWQEFHGVKRVALDFRVVRTSRPHRNLCPCHGRPHTCISDCPEMLNCFFSYFKDLKEFYFVVKLTCAIIAAPKPTPETKAKKVSKKTYIPRYMAQFREIAHREGLEIFEDSKYTYYEVRRQDTKKILLRDDVWQSIDRVQKLYKDRIKNRPHLVKALTFKVLVIADI